MMTGGGVSGFGTRVGFFLLLASARFWLESAFSFLAFCSAVILSFSWSLSALAFLRISHAMAIARSRPAMMNRFRMSFQFAPTLTVGGGLFRGVVGLGEGRFDPASFSVEGMSAGRRVFGPAFALLRAFLKSATVEKRSAGSGWVAFRQTSSRFESQLVMVEGACAFGPWFWPVMRP